MRTQTQSSAFEGVGVRQRWSFHMTDKRYLAALVLPSPSQSRPDVCDILLSSAPLLGYFYCHRYLFYFILDMKHTITVDVHSGSLASTRAAHTRRTDRSKFTCLHPNDVFCV